MALITLVSAGGAPGVTTTALALTLTWPDRALLAETDAAGGSVLAGFFGCHLPYDRGLLQLAMRLQDQPADPSALLWEQTLPLDETGRRPVLPGPRDPFQAEALSAATWQQLAGLLAAQRCDVLADTGQILSGGYPLLAAADLIVVVLRPTTRQVAAAVPRLAWVRRELGHTPLGLCLIGDGPHTAGEVRDALGDFAVVVLLPWDPRAAGRLSDGTPHRRNLATSALLSQAKQAAQAISASIPRQGSPVAFAAPRSGRGSR